MKKIKPFDKIKLIQEYINLIKVLELELRFTQCPSIAREIEEYKALMKNIIYT